jgi:hypothetical protein
MENVNYECLIPSKIKKCKLSVQGVDQIKGKIEVFFDKAVAKEQICSLPKIHNGTVKYRVLDLKLDANIQNILQEACGGSFDDIENISFDTLETVQKFVVHKRALLSKDESTDIFVVGNNKLFFIVRAHKKKGIVSLYVGLSNFDLPFSGGSKHKLFINLR